MRQMSAAPGHDSSGASPAGRTAPSEESSFASVSTPTDSRRWLVLAVIAIAQLMVVLDLTIMNIALPSAQRALHFNTVDRQWVVTAYSLAFGSLLLLGGRLADLLGRKVTFSSACSASRAFRRSAAPRSTFRCW